MSADEKKIPSQINTLSIGALMEGFVLDHIAAGHAMTIYRYLKLGKLDCTVAIIKNATSNSLLILDEIGRGTSTFDGMSIARAVLEYIANPKTLGAKTLFATHYHELTSMSKEFHNIKNYNIEVKKRGDDITFLRRIIPGGADDSYGIEVAKLAGLPQNIIERSKEILKMLESNNYPGTSIKNENTNDISQISLSDYSSKSNEIIEKLKNIDVSVLTPVESMNILYSLVEMTKN